MRDDLTPTFAAPDLPPPGNDPGDCRYPAHTELTARLLRMMEERALFELARAEQRLARLEKNFLRRKQLRTVPGGRP